MKETVRKTRTRTFREVELLIWLLIILILSVTCFSIYKAKQKSYELHNIFVPDVDGLIVGSPVNLMGVPVGHVTRMKIISDNEVYIKFVIKDKTIKLPKGTIANIEFFGLGGSKSIELYPPDNDYVKQFGLNTDNYIVVAKLIKLHDSMHLLYDMFAKLGSIINKTANFGLELKNSNIQTETKNVQNDIDKFIEYSSDMIDKFQEKMPINYKQTENRGCGHE